MPLFFPSSQICLAPYLKEESVMDYERVLASVSATIDLPVVFSGPVERAHPFGHLAIVEIQNRFFSGS